MKIGKELKGQSSRIDRLNAVSSNSVSQKKHRIDEFFEKECKMLPIKRVMWRKGGKK